MTVMKSLISLIVALLFCIIMVAVSGLVVKAGLPPEALGPVVALIAAVVFFCLFSLALEYYVRSIIRAESKKRVYEGEVNGEPLTRLRR